MIQNLLAFIASLFVFTTHTLPHPTPSPKPTPSPITSPKPSPTSSCDVDLLINGQDDPSGIVKLDDLKPGDDRKVDKDVFLKNCAGKVYLHLKDLKSSQGVQTEPEVEEEKGTPKSDLQNYLNYDLQVGDKIVISLGDNVPFPQVFSCWIPIEDVAKESHLTVTQSWHFDPTVTNWAQGDLLTFAEEWVAISGDVNAPKTDSGRVWDPKSRTCVPGTSPTPKPSSTPKVSPTPKPTPTPKASPTPKSTPHSTPWPFPFPKTSPWPWWPF